MVALKVRLISLDQNCFKNLDGLIVAQLDIERSDKFFYVDRGKNETIMAGGIVREASLGYRCFPPEALS